MKTIKIISVFCAMALCSGLVSCRKQFPEVQAIQFAEPVIYTGDISEDVAVNLGLSVDWASRNLGALRPEDFGNYYIWGKLTVYASPKEMDNYNNPSYAASTVLKPEHDAATETLGANFRQPTFDEILELKEKCTWLFAKYNGVLGYVVTGTTGNSIFLPCANFYGKLGYAGISGYGWYESGLYRSVNVSTDSSMAKAISFSGKGIDTGDADRYLACPIRPVVEITNP